MDYGAGEGSLFANGTFVLEFAFAEEGHKDPLAALAAMFVGCARIGGYTSPPV
jgi:hypothetical protein